MVKNRKFKCIIKPKERFLQYKCNLDQHQKTKQNIKPITKKCLPLLLTVKSIKHSRQ